MAVLLRNRTRYRCSAVLFERLLYRTQNIISLPIDEISLAIVPKDEMRKINRAYRGADAPTDVLAFEYGEILLCPAYIKEKYGLSAPREVRVKMHELFVHGLVHIGGFDHRTKREEADMKKVEEKIL